MSPSNPSSHGSGNSLEKETEKVLEPRDYKEHQENKSLKSTGQMHISPHRDCAHRCVPDEAIELKEEVDTAFSL